MSVEKMMAAKARFIPKDGYNVVGVDTYEREPGEELYLIGHFKDHGQAETARAKHAESSEDPVYIYGPTD